jgi:hypothetical protein
LINDVDGGAFAAPTFEHFDVGRATADAFGPT